LNAAGGKSANSPDPFASDTLNPLFLVLCLLLFLDMSVEVLSIPVE
jgi:hypothetical protein